MKKLFRFNTVYLTAFVVLLGIEVVIALFVHDEFIRPFVGDVLVVAVIYCFVRAFTARIKLLPLWIFLFASAVEGLQYINIVRFLGFENNRLISTIIGGTFDFIDILCYTAGCALLFLWEYILWRRSYDK